MLGPPPAAFLALNPEKAAQFWDEDGMCGLDSHSTCRVDPFDLLTTQACPSQEGEQRPSTSLDNQVSHKSTPCVCEIHAQDFDMDAE
jgi:hypothetical protein